MKPPGTSQGVERENLGRHPRYVEDDVRFASKHLQLLDVAIAGAVHNRLKQSSEAGEPQCQVATKHLEACRGVEWPVADDPLEAVESEQGDARRLDLDDRQRPRLQDAPFVTDHGQRNIRHHLHGQIWLSVGQLNNHIL